MTGKAFLFLALITLTATAAAWFGARGAVEFFERDTETRLAEGLRAAGQSWAVAEADGLTVILSGEAPGEQGRFRALEVLGRLIDSARIRDRSSVSEKVADARPDFALEILRDGQEISLIGIVPGDDSRRAVLAALAPRDAAGARGFTNLMEAVEYLPPEGWQAALDYALGHAPDLPRSRIRVTPGHVAVQAHVADGAELVRWQERLETGARQADLGTTLDLTAPRPVISPFVFTAETAADGTLSVSDCTYANPDAGTALATRMQAMGSDAPCILALGAPSARWQTALLASLEALAALPGARVTITDADLALIAAPGTRPDDFDTATTRLRDALPPVFSVTTTLPPVDADQNDGQRPPEPSFTASANYPQGVTLAGPVRDEIARAAIVSFASAQWGFGGVTDTMELDDAVADGWTQQVLDGLAALGNLQAGDLTVTGNQITVDGTATSDAARERLIAFLAERRPDAEVTAEIEIVAALPLAAAGPTPAECEAKLKLLLDVDQIVFAPNSAEITDESATLLDEMAKIIRSCPDTAFEIGGHTDSQGREEMNLALSQARAEAVMDGLLAREVFLDQITAQGYGESRPIADNDTEAGRATNRRIEIRRPASDPDEQNTSDTAQAGTEERQDDAEN